MDFIVRQKGFWADDDDLVLKAIHEGFIQTHYAMWKELGEYLFVCVYHNSEILIYLHCFPFILYRGLHKASITHLFKCIILNC